MLLHLIPFGSLHNGLSSIIMLLSYYFLLSWLVKHLSRNEDSEIPPHHTLVLVLFTFFSGQLGFFLGEGATAYLFGILNCSIVAFAICVTLMRLPPRVSLLISLAASILMFLTVWFGEAAEKVISRLMLS
jgi:hypothetical protein